MSGVLVYDGSFVFADLDLHIDAAPAPTTFSWRVGAVSEENLCDQGLGWRLDVFEPSDATTHVAANETHELRLRAKSFDRPACDATENLARCGGSVELLVMTGDDVVVASLDTTFECLFVAATLP